MESTLIEFIQQYLGISSDNSFLVELSACLLLVAFVVIVLSAFFGVLLAIFRGRR